MEVQGVQRVVLSAIVIVGGGALTWLLLKPDSLIQEPVGSKAEEEAIPEMQPATKPERKYTINEACTLRD